MWTKWGMPPNPNPLGMSAKGSLHRLQMLGPLSHLCSSSTDDMQKNTGTQAHARPQKVAKYHVLLVSVQCIVVRPSQSPQLWRAKRPKWKRDWRITLKPIPKLVIQAPILFAMAHGLEHLLRKVQPHIGNQRQQCWRCSHCRDWLLPRQSTSLGRWWQVPADGDTTRCITQGHARTSTADERLRKLRSSPSPHRQVDTCHCKPDACGNQTLKERCSELLVRGGDGERERGEEKENEEEVADEGQETEKREERGEGCETW